MLDLEVFSQIIHDQRVVVVGLVAISCIPVDADCHLAEVVRRDHGQGLEEHDTIAQRLLHLVLSVQECRVSTQVSQGRLSRAYAGDPGK